MNTADDHAEAAAIRDERYRRAAKLRYVNGGDGGIEIQDDAAVELDTICAPGSPVEERGGWIAGWLWIPRREVEPPAHCRTCQGDGGVIPDDGEPRLECPACGGSGRGEDLANVGWGA